MTTTTVRPIGPSYPNGQRSHRIGQLGGIVAMSNATVAAEAVVNIVKRSGARVDLPEPAATPGARWSMATLANAWRGALSRGTTPFALADQTTIDDWGLISFMIRTAPSHADAVAAAMKRLSLITTRGRWALAENHAEWIASAPTSDEDLAATTSTLAHIVVCATQLAGQAAVREVSLRDRSFGAAQWFRDRGIGVRFGADKEAIVFGELHARPSHAHPELFAHLCNEADRALAALPTKTFTSRVRDIALKDLSRADAQRVARTLAIAPRTLRRRLRDEGTSLRAIVDDLRRAEADSMLALDVSTAEISDALGFSDPSAFARAYRRWTGRSPRGLADKSRLTRSCGGSNVRGHADPPRGRHVFAVYRRAHQEEGEG